MRNYQFHRVQSLTAVVGWRAVTKFKTSEGGWDVEELPIVAIAAVFEWRCELFTCRDGRRPGSCEYEHHQDTGERIVPVFLGGVCYDGDSFMHEDDDVVALLAPGQEYDHDTLKQRVEADEARSAARIKTVTT